MVIGVRSVFSGVIGGAAGTVSRITGALGKGLASLTFDEKFQTKRREGIKKRGRQNFGESLARGGKGLVMGIFDGVTGVATKPIEGAREEGVGGFFKGVGKGVVGLVARPTGGIIDFASGTFDSVKRVTEVTEEVNRVRPPRFLNQVSLPFENITSTLKLLTIFFICKLILMEICRYWIKVNLVQFHINKMIFFEYQYLI